jgi:hypothetical protein
VPDNERGLFEQFKTKSDLTVCTYTDIFPSRLVTLEAGVAGVKVVGQLLGQAIEDDRTIDRVTLV